jgi:hypothetical protein
MGGGRSSVTPLSCPGRRHVRGIVAYGVQWSYNRLVPTLPPLPEKLHCVSAVLVTEALGPCRGFGETDTCTRIASTAIMGRRSMTTFGREPITTCCMLGHRCIHLLHRDLLPPLGRVSTCPLRFGQPSDPVHAHSAVKR